MGRNSFVSVYGDRMRRWYASGKTGQQRMEIMVENLGIMSREIRGRLLTCRVKFGIKQRRIMFGLAGTSRPF